MTTVLIIFCITAAAMMLSVIFLPTAKIGKISFGPYWVIALIGAIVLLCFKTLPMETLFKSLTANTAVNPLKILALFISMTTLSVYLDEVGFFKYLAVKAIERSQKSQTALFFSIYLTVSVLTVFTSNDIVILTFTPFICYFAASSGVSPVPFLFAEFVGANTWSSALIIGNPTNIYLASSAGVTFSEYFLVMWLPTIAGGLASLLILYLLFRKSLHKEMHLVFYEKVTLDKGQLIIGLIHLVGCTLLLIVSQYVNIEMWLITVCFALSLIITVSIYKVIKREKFTELKNTLKRAPWQLIPFVLSMFVFVVALDNCGFTALLGRFLSGIGETVLTFGATSFLACNVINNIPMSVLFSGVLNSTPSVNYLGGVFAAIIGSNYGAILTPIGALAGIMWESILKERNVNFGFGKFVKYGAAVSVPTLIAALFALKLALSLFV